MKIIGTIPKRLGDKGLIIEATPEEIRRILGLRWSSDFDESKMVPGVEIKVDAIAGHNQVTFESIEKLKDLPQTLRALADILTREVKVLNVPPEQEAPKADPTA